MKSVADPQVVAALRARLESVTPDRSRVWGTMSAQQMLVHLGDGAQAALGNKPFSAPARKPSKLLKWVALRAPLRWPRGVKSGAEPARVEVSAVTFEKDRQRAIDGLAALAAPDAATVSTHPIFGPMDRTDWQRWAYLHTDHHLRQFGV